MSSVSESKKQSNVSKATNSPLLSIIIPVYGVEQYLSQCVESVLSQTFRDIEVILADDGSPDNCPGMCDKYAAEDTRVTVIHKSNGGLSDARNTGILKASGKYLLFVDSDDFIAENSLERIACALKNDSFPDVLFLDSVLYFDGGENTERTQPYGYAFQKEDFYGKSKKEVLHYLSRGGQFHVSACIKAVKRELISEKGIFFTKGIIGEDVDFSINLYLHASAYSYLGAPYYYYRQERQGSIMFKKSDKRFSDLLLIISKWAASAEGEYKEHKDWVLKFLFHQYYVLLSLYMGVGKELKTNSTRAELRRFAYLLKYTDNKKACVLYIFLKLFGVTPASGLINMFERKQ